MDRLCLSGSELIGVSGSAVPGTDIHVDRSIVKWIYKKW